jgi:hypothetical protein
VSLIASGYAGAILLHKIDSGFGVFGHKLNCEWFCVAVVNWQLLWVMMMIDKREFHDAGTPFKELTATELDKRLPTFRGSEGSLPRSQKPAAGSVS